MSVVVFLLTPGLALAALTPVTDRATLCSLKYGRYVKATYVGSTPMEDACRTENAEARRHMCQHNYKRPELVEACVDTYNPVTEQIRQTKETRP